MSDRFHIIITGESGRSSCIQLSRRKIYQAIALTTGTFFAAALVFFVSGGSFFADREVQALQSELAWTARAEHAYRTELEHLKSSKDEQIETLKNDYEFRLTDQRVRYDLENANLQLENATMVNSAIGDLNSRCELIETVMDKIGVEIIKTTPTVADNSGGPFVPADEQPHEELVKKVDEYLRTIQFMPLGKPINGSISSKFGTRTDPLNKKKGIHEGVDIRAKHGDKIRATADGVVVKSFKNAGYGNYLEIDHGNGYRTVFAHMQKYLVKKGESITRGQVIGLVGSTGRSTGPHLHYEIRLNKKPINPNKFMQVADLTHTIADSTH